MEIKQPDLDLAWGAAAIGKVIGRNRRQTFYLLEKGHIKGAKKVGGQWVGEHNNLRKSFTEDAG